MLMIFIILISFSGCVTSRILSNSDLPVAGDYSYKILSKNTNFLLRNVEISNGILSGNIETIGSNRYTNIVNIYLTSDSVIKVDTGKNIIVPVDSITKVKLVKAATGRSFFLVVGITAVLVGILLHSFTLDINPFPYGI